MGNEIDSTFIIQILNTIIWILIIGGVFYAVRKLLRNKNEILERQKSIEDKLDILLERER